PTCGAEQPPAREPSAAPPPAGESPAAPRSRPIPLRSETPGKAARDKAIPWVVLGVGLAAILLLAVALGPRHGDDSATSAAAAVKSAAPRPPDHPVNPNDLALGDLTKVDPIDVLGRAKTRALAWNRDAVLVSLRAQPVSAGKVNVESGGTLEYFFGKPTGEGFGAGTRVSGKRFRIAIAASGTTAEEVAGGLGRAALEPNCPLDEAARKAQAAGLPSSAPVSAAYEISEKHKKAVWRVAVASNPTETRTLDGWTCAVLIR
ncbi:MAG TPA: hypothetical protein VF395_14940, partial [Polyangiaceae bacterium]